MKKYERWYQFKDKKFELRKVATVIIWILYKTCNNLFLKWFKTKTSLVKLTSNLQWSNYKI